MFIDLIDSSVHKKPRGIAVMTYDLLSNGPRVFVPQASAYLLTYSGSKKIG